MSTEQTQGALVALEDGRWAICTQQAPGIAPGFVNAVLPHEPNPYVIPAWPRTTLLLSPPAHYPDATALLAGLAGLLGAVVDKVPAGHAAWVPLGFGELLILVSNEGKPITAWYRPDENLSCTEYNYEARGRDWQREGALRQYLRAWQEGQGK